MVPRVTLEDRWQLCPNHEKVKFAESVLPFNSRQRLLYRFLGQAFRFAAVEEPSLAEYADNITRENMNKAGIKVAELQRVRGDGSSICVFSAYFTYLNAYTANMSETSEAIVPTSYPNDDGGAYKERIAWCEEELFRP